jgi:hypothetical protein
MSSEVLGDLAKTPAAAAKVMAAAEMATDMPTFEAEILKRTRNLPLYGQTPGHMPEAGRGSAMEHMGPGALSPDQQRMINQKYHAYEQANQLRKFSQSPGVLGDQIRGLQGQGGDPVQDTLRGPGPEIKSDATGTFIRDRFGKTHWIPGKSARGPDKFTPGRTPGVVPAPAPAPAPAPRPDPPPLAGSMWQPREPSDAYEVQPPPPPPPPDPFRDEVYRHPRIRSGMRCTGWVETAGCPLP